MGNCMDVISNLSGYEITEQLYAGHRTLVYRALRHHDQVSVVIKLLRNEFPSFNELVQFRNQYAIAKTLNSPNIITTYGLEPYNNSYALIMEDFGGVSLKEWAIKRGIELSLQDFLRIVISLSETLNTLHINKIIHKDLKPANILVNPDTKEVKLIDFSIASLLPRESIAIQNVNNLEGTLAYLSPEQTGRMNRGIDYRSDFYSFGITLYELLTKKLPFVANDPMELVHCHLAKSPIPVHQLDTEIPLALSAIISKLMAKNAEDRYQTALGLKHDLERCLDQLQRTGTIEIFPLGERDISDRFLIPEKLYGREQEVSKILNAFERVTQGGVEMMLVAGSSGIGKTAVVNEVHKPITRQRGYFIKGKYEQFQRNIPFSAFVQAFRDLMTKLLSESDVQLQNWKDKILQTLGENGQILIEVIPELVSIIGQQPLVPELSGNAAQNRFNQLMQKFVNVFTSVEYPLVIFLDDLQWADLASLKLLQLLMKDSGHLLVIGAYRDNEVSSTHPFTMTVEDLLKTGAVINTVTLKPLTENDLNQLVADTLNCDRTLNYDPNNAQILTELIFQKTKGNPFFATQFLKTLYEGGQIFFDAAKRYWQCDITQTKALAIADDVVEFMSLQLQKLPTETQEILKLAACIGAQFDLRTLALVSGLSSEDTANALWAAIQEELVIPITDVYKFFPELDCQTDCLGDINATYRFLHDRVQQASYSLILDNQRHIIHLKIGQLLRQQHPLEQNDSHIFEIVNQLNLGAFYIEQNLELNELAQLNLKAGCKAKLSTAYGSASEYFRDGLKALGHDCWKTSYALSVQLYQELAEVEYLKANFVLALDVSKVVIEEAKTLLDKIRSYELTVQVYISLDKQVEAIETGLKTLELLGVNLVPEDADHQPYLEKLPSVESLDQYPTTTDPVILAALRILMAITPPIHHVKPHLFPSVALTMVGLCFEHGHSPLATYAYGIYGLFLTAVVNDIESAYLAGKLSLKLLEQYDAKELKTKVEMLFGVFVCAGKEAGRATISLLQESIQSGLEMGDIEYMSYCIMADCAHEVLVGELLETTSSRQERYTDLLIQFQQKHCLDYTQIWQQLIQNLQGKVQVSGILNGEDFNEEDSLRYFQETHNHQSLFALYLTKTLLAYTLENDLDAWFYSSEAEKYADGAFGVLLVSAHNFYQSLAALALVKQNIGDREVLLQKVRTNQLLMRSWATHAPMNYLHKYHLVEAEYSHVMGSKAEALDHYDRAIQLAQENQFFNEEAMANELAAKFYLNWGKEKLAQSYMTDAYYCYVLWGAKAKVDDLERRYPQLLAPILQKTQQSFSTTETIFALSSNTSKTSTSSTGISDTLDLSTILKASQSLSSEIELEKLLATLLHIVTENAGADKCALLMSKDDEWVIEALSQIGQEEEVLQSIPIAESQEVPVSLINIIKNTLNPLVIWDATLHPTLANDPYIIAQSPKSILCNPIIHQGKLIAILYLENSLTVGAFTSDRILILNILCTQAAISLENARLYQELQQYTQYLEKSESTYRVLINTIPDLLMHVNRDGIYLDINGFNRLNVQNADQFITGASVYDSLPSDKAEIRMQAVQRALETQKIQIYEQQFVADSQAQYEEVRVAVCNQDEALIIVRDISERKQIEAERKQKSEALEKALQELQQAQLQMIQSEKMSALGNLVAGVAHEINNPVGFLGGNIRPALDYINDLFGLLDLYQRKYPQPDDDIQNEIEAIDLDYIREDLPKLIASMREGVARIRGISNSLRTFSRADSDRPVACNIHDGIDSTIMILKHRLKGDRYRPEIQVIKEYGDLPQVECFAGQLNQVFMNILANAIDAIEESNQGLSFADIKAKPNCITITTSVENNHVKIAIADNGNGMTEEVQQKVFDHLFTTKVVGKGTGLGLAIARQIVVEKHGGSLDVRSELNRGTEFCIRLPMGIIQSKFEEAETHDTT